jgi:hypothetical protein
MSELVIHGHERVLGYLQQRADACGSTMADEARRILEQALRPMATGAWTHINALREKLAASGRSFSDSTALIREDRDR